MWPLYVCFFSNSSVSSNVHTQKSHSSDQSAPCSLSTVSRTVCLRQVSLGIVAGDTKVRVLPPSQSNTKALWNKTNVLPDAPNKTWA